MGKLQQYSMVRLCSNRFFDEGVKEGDTGYIIEVYSGGHYEVEFSNPKTGCTIALIVAHEEELEPIE